MKITYINLYLIALFVFILNGCVSSSEPTHSSASWAYPFVKVYGESYEAPINDNDKEVSESYVGKKIGVVKRNVESMDAGPNKYVEKNLDSNFLNKGTPLYEDKKDKNAIIYEKNGKFYLTTKVTK